MWSCLSRKIGERDFAGLGLGSGLLTHSCISSAHLTRSLATSLTGAISTTFVIYETGIATQYVALFSHYVPRVDGAIGESHVDRVYMALR